MKKNHEFNQDQIVKFSKKTKVYELNNKIEFFVPRGTTAKVILDEDVGEIGSCKVKIKKKNGDVVVVETDDKNLKIVK